MECWVASQAGRIVATPLSEVGSIGVYSTAFDMSEMNKQDGIKPIVMRSGAQGYGH